MDYKQFLSDIAPLVGGNGNISNSDYRDNRMMLALKDCDAVQLDVLQILPEVARAELTRNRLRIVFKSDYTGTEEQPMAKNYAEIARFVVDKIGGKENVETYTHCITRLRFVLRDKSKVAQEDLKANPAILSIVEQGGQYQLVIGNDVEKVYNEVKKILGDLEGKAAAAPQTAEKKKPLDRVMGFVQASVAPAIPVIVACGLINALLALAVQFLGLSTDSGTYQAWRSLANVGFTYLPVWMAFAGARYLNADSYVAAFLSLGMIICFSGQEGMSVFGLTIPTINYGSSIVPVLLMVPVFALLDHFLGEHLPKNLVYMFKPLLSSIIMAPLILFVFGPVGAFCGTILVDICTALMNFGPISMAILAAAHPITVIFGMHSLFTPILVNELADSGMTFVLCRALAANFAMAGAALGVGIKAKKMQNKSTGFTSSITALLAATEPALYGCLLPLRRPLIAACGAAAVSGFFIGLFRVHAYSMGSFNVFTLAYCIGGNSMTNFFLACAFAALAFVLGLVFTLLMGFKEE